jgi:4-amino-4-deoxy-L-arabinose transferase-like glycosyltransferase
MRAHRSAGLLVALLTVGALALRLSQIHQSLFGDEVLAYREIARHTLTGTIDVVGRGVESSPPLFFIFAWLTAKLGDPTVWMRLPSILLGAATVPLTYLLGRLTVGRFAGGVAAAILALSPFSLYYGVEGRPYATAAFFVAVSTLALIQAVRGGRRRWWALYALAAAGAAYSHYTTLFVLLVQGAWSLWACRGRLREPLLANLAAALLFLPWIPFVHGSDLAVYGFLEPLGVHNVIRDLVRVIPGYPYAPLRAIPTRAGLIVIGACALAGAIALAAGWRASRASRPRFPPAPRPAGGLGLIVALALAAPVGLLLYSVLATDIWDARDLYASVPAMALVLGALLAALPSWARPVAVAAVLAVLGFGTVRAIGPAYARPPYRAAAAYLDRVAAPRDPVLMYSWAFVLDQAIAVQLHRPHRLLHGLVVRWPSPPPGGSLYVVVDQAVLRALKLRSPHHPGYALVSRRRYRGLVPFDVFGFRRTGG